MNTVHPVPICPIPKNMVWWYVFFFLTDFFFVQIESKTFRQFSNNVVHLKVDTKWHNISVTQFFCESSEKLIQIKEGFKSENLTKL